MTSPEPVRRNILLLSAGRRVSLARAFRRIADEHGVRFITGDMAPALSAACQDNGDHVTLPHVRDPGYPAALGAVCRDHHVGLVVPTIDTELPVLAALRASLLDEGTSVIVCDEPLITVARDKRRTAEHFGAMGVPSPTVYPVEAPVYPAIAKPFDGSLSKNVTVLRGPEDYTAAVRQTANLMVAAYLDHATHEEFTCDAYYDRGGTLRCVVPRLRIEVRGGEVAKGRTERNGIVDLFEQRLGQLDGARGCLTFQFFRNRDTGALFLIELNARFGGGSPLSLAAGAAFPPWLFDEYILGLPVATERGWASGLTMLRYDAEVLVPAGAGA